MRKAKIMCVALCFALVTQVFALKTTRDFAIGAELTSVNLETFGAMLTTHLPKVPLYIGIGGNFYNELSGGPELTTSIDYWLVHTSQKTINFYFGLGLCGTMRPDLSWYAAGLRLPLGLQTWPLNNESMELFLEVAPAWVPLQSAGADWDAFQAQIALGVRFWFDR
jgi:hypothetical protein